MVCLKCVVFLQLLCLIDACAWFSYHWESWSSCTESCGGGRRHRTEYSCVKHDKGKTQYEDCNEFCYHGHRYSGGGCNCPSWRSGRCCETCRHIYIPHCQSGRQTCGGSPDNIKCTQCVDPYYSGGYGKGCLTCPGIANCNHRHCTAPSNTKCIKCIDDNVFFKRTTGDRKCERLCAWNNHYCWPGTCGSDLTKNCQCSSEFSLTRTNGETSCQPSKRPEIQTCLTTFAGSNGEKKQTSSSSSSTACKFLQDVYGNVQVTSITYQTLSEFTIPTPTETQPKYIKESNFGVTDVTIHLKKNLVSGRLSEVGRHLLLQDTSNGTNANQTFASDGNVSTSSRTYHLQNGDWLCVEYESLGGGYLKSIDISNTSHPVLDAIPYRKTTTSRNLCYRYDDVPPAHCKATRNCTADPLFIQDKVTKLTEIPVFFQNWFDPIPTSGDKYRASSIESYQITVHETIPSNGKVQVDSGHVFTKKLNFTETSMVIALNSTTPLLYCIVLEVKDIADNVRQARRFVLYDNSTHIEIRTEHPLTVNSASVNSKYKWQTHHNDICINWKDHFTNLFYQNNKFLNPIEPDPHGLITGVYDQIDGVLSVSGTVNVNGIIRYTYFWALNSGNFSRGIDVANVTRQSYCKHFDLKDGQTFTLKVQATDIANNTCEDNTTVHIDRSVPHIKNIWLQKGNHTTFFAHDSKELSTMNLFFEALDPHSGIQNIQWSFGTTDMGMDLLNGSLRVVITPNTSCTKSLKTCYCPAVGNCELSNYSIPLNRLAPITINQGNNRKYYFSIKVTNYALLSNIEHVEILVNSSRTETKTALEGSLITTALLPSTHRVSNVCHVPVDKRTDISGGCNFNSGNCGYIFPPYLWSTHNETTGAIIFGQTDNDIGMLQTFAVFQSNDPKVDMFTVAEMTTPIINGIGDFCMAFWILMTNKNSQLEIYLQSVPTNDSQLIFAYKQMLTSQWKKVELPFHVNKPFKVVFRSTKENNYGFVGIDNVRFFTANTTTKASVFTSTSTTITSTKRIPSTSTTIISVTTATLPTPTTTRTIKNSLKDHNVSTTQSATQTKESVKTTCACDCPTFESKCMRRTNLPVTPIPGICAVPEMQRQAKQFLSCNFDKDVCHFYVPVYPHLWERVSYNFGTSDIGIINGDQSPDHSGGYMVFNTYNNHVQSNQSHVLQSPQLSPNAAYCLSFWYIMPTNHSNLEVYVKYIDGSPAKLLWTIRSVWHNDWTHQYIGISETKPFYVMFRSVKNGLFSFLGLDNVQFSIDTTASTTGFTTPVTSSAAFTNTRRDCNCSCPVIDCEAPSPIPFAKPQCGDLSMATKLKDQSCDFNNRNACNYDIPAYPHLWEVHHYEYGNDSSRSINGDSSKEGDGGYLLFNTNNFHVQPGQIDEVSSSFISNDDNTCVTFLYNMPTITATLEVYQDINGQRTLLWKREGIITTGWTRGTFLIPRSPRYKVVFASRKTELDSYIGVDSIDVFTDLLL